MEADKRNFIDREFPGLLRKLQPDTPRKWGQMNPQQMVEHLTDYVRVASGKSPVEIHTSHEHLPAFKRFLSSDKDFRPDTKNPLNGGPPNPERNRDLNAAIEEYLSEMAYFNETFRQNPGKQTAHPAFGLLTKDEWMLLQYKHLMHHARQFDLL